jgi:NADPH:quinone reductase-like Zn-dependent oxidoreductase
MRTYQIATYGSVDGLKLVDRPDPVPGDHEVVVRLRAASLNYRDLVVVKGEYDRNPQLDRVPLSDGAGEVVAAGSAVRRLKVGDKVAGCFFQGWFAGKFRAEYMTTALGGAMDGVLAEYVVFDKKGVIQLPEGYSFEEGATLPCAALTAWNALIERGGLRAGETVLLLGTGGVSLFGLQIARATGARVIITSKDDKKLERARALGADEVINYRTTPDWGKRALELTSGEGVDHVVEVGGAGTFKQSLRGCSFGARIELIGILTGRAPVDDLFPVVHRQVTVHGIYVGSREMFESMNRAFAQAKIKPVIDRVFDFSEAPEAYRYLESGAHFGKIVIRI